MKIAMMQPSFMPWQGFFELIFKSDLFIVLDDFQFSVQSYHQRNRLFVNKGQVDWYTVPVKKSKSFGGAISEAVTNDSVPWRKKMWKRIKQNYSKASFFHETAPLIETWLLESKGSLADFNMEFINMITRLLKIDTKIQYSSQFASDTKRSDKVLALLRWGEASQYLCAKGSFDYMKEDGVFPIEDIAVFFQEYVPKPYRQIGSPDMFVPYLSVLDAVLNIGPDKTRDLIGGGTGRWLTWDELCCSSKQDHSTA